jgi:hypothetical protein
MQAGSRMTKRKIRIRKHVIADMSLHHLAYITMSCTFTIEPTRADYRYDLTTYTFDTAGQYENGNVFVQLKATDKLNVDPTTGEIKFRISKRDILAWESEPFPVYLVAFDATHGKAYSTYLQRYFARAGISSVTLAAASVEVRLPNKEVNAGAVHAWRADKNAVLRQMGAVIHV